MAADLDRKQRDAEMKDAINKKLTENFERERYQQPTIYLINKAYLQLNKENFQFKNTISVMNEERSEEYGDILSFVSICLTLLWRLSLSDACVSTMLTRKSIEKFLEYISRSLDSFLETSKEDSQLDSSSDEFALVLSIGGIITNIAATALGREFLVTKESGIKVIDALILYLSEMPPQHGVEIKNLILKAMYNTSINSKGLKYLSSKKGLMTTLGMLLKEETDTELRLSLVRCIQSLVIEPESASLAHEIMEVIPVSKFQEYADLSKGELKKTTLELISDLTVFLQSQP